MELLPGARFRISPEPGSESRRSPVQNLAGAWCRMACREPGSEGSRFSVQNLSWARFRARIQSPGSLNTAGARLRKSAGARF